MINDFENKESENEKGKIDTGASGTVIPIKYISELELVPHGEVWTRGYDYSPPQRNTTYFIKISFNGFEFHTEVICKDRPNILIGRDILNELYLVLDGIKQKFEIK